MAEMQVMLTTEERDVLVGLLETALKETQIEEHRTRKPSYRELVLHQEQVIASVLSKLGQPAK